ncbi:uncharacterized protein LOC119998563 [Tripterygium wilfordii]|uniref:uncharacterized protein LOC119998563 n=1 Tax=Tripterygium wilfordii TaxID=458696 RepID=UPI0018F847FB|nr:uncharacterized protein LOC119998563 [Tripterygium wilfordii]
MANHFASSPWLLLGDFNAILRPLDCVGGQSSWPTYMDDFSDCMASAELNMLPYKGLHYTWSNGQLGDNSILRKLNWAFGNNNCFPAVVFCSWARHLSCSLMCYLFSKLCRLKGSLKQLNRHEIGHISYRILKARCAWESVRVMLDDDLTNLAYQSEERILARNYFSLCQMEESFYRKKSRIYWLTLGDNNIIFFHRSIVHRQSRNKISSLAWEDDSLTYGQSKIALMTVSYFQDMFTTTPSIVILDLSNDKAPGPDGFSSCFL